MFPITPILQEPDGLSASDLRALDDLENDFDASFEYITQNFCSSPAPQKSPSVCLSAPAVAVQEVCPPTLEQFQRCPLSAQQRPSDSLAAPVEAVLGVCTSPTIEQFQRWLETEAHTAHQQYSLGYGHETLQQETDRCRNAAQRIAKLRLSMELLLDFKDQA